MEPIKHFDLFVAHLKKILKEQSIKDKNPIGLYDISTHLYSCSCESLVDKYLYFYIPFSGTSEEVKRCIKNYVKEEDLHFIVTKKMFCDELWCTGHESDPFIHKVDNDNVLVNQLPDNIHGANIYFLRPEKMIIFRAMQDTFLPTQ